VKAGLNTHVKLKKINCDLNTFEKLSEKNKKKMNRSWIKQGHDGRKQIVWEEEGVSGI
jgi:hypothetical protein